ncbi:putative ribonuclease H-like domain-containing protein [Tanacetum coccineum]
MTRIPVEDVAPAAHEKPSESSPKDNDVQDSEDVADKEGQHQMTEDEQVLHDDLEKMIAQEVVATALDDATRQAFEEEKRNIASQKRAAQTTSITKLSTGRSSVSTATTPYVSAASTSTGANAGESSFVYLGGKIPIDASTLPNADLPIDPNMPDLEDDSDAFSSDGIFNGAYDDENVGAVADFNNMDDTINVSPIPTLRIHKNHPKDQILGDPKSAVQTRGKIQKASSAQQAFVSYISKQNRTNHKDHQNCLLACFLSQEEPKNILQALQDEIWVEAMQEELLQFKLQKVWILVDLPSGKKAIGTKWVFKNKRDERSIVVKNKARLVAQGFRQEEGIDYDEVFAHVARIEAIRLFLAFASYMGLTVYQMDVKSVFLYGTIEEEVYVHQPLGFVDPAHPNKVYKVIKALYGLHQAPRAWYETLSSFLMENGFRRGTIDKTLFIKKKKSDIMLVQVYVDDIIFGSTKKSMCTEFEDCMHKRFQMSSMGELTFFLGLQVKQPPDGIFISQDKYVADILKKFNLWSIRTATTPIESNKPLVKDEDGEDVDVHVYSSIHYALTVGPVVSTTFVEQFWMSAKSKIINNVRYITAKVAGKLVTISEASIRRDLLFDDDDGIDFLHNQAIFDVIQLMGHLDAKKKFVVYPRFISVFLTNQLHNAPVPLDHFPINALTPKVFSFMVKKGKKNSRNVTPLFSSMLAQPTEDEGAVLERPSDTQPTPSPPHPSADQHDTQPDPSPRPSPTIPIPDSIPEGSGGNHGGQSSSDRSLSGNEDGLTLQSVYDLCVSLCKQVTTQAAQIKDLKSQIKQPKKKAKPVISHHTAWMKSARKPAKFEPTMHKDPAFDDLDDIMDDAMDYMETKDAQDKGRTSSVVLKEKESAEKRVSTEDQVSTVKPDEGTDKPKVGTDKPEVSTAKPNKVEVSTDKLDEGTVEPKDGASDESTAPTTVFRDDETIAEILVSMSQNKAKQNGVEIKDVEDSDRPRATSTRSVLTLKPLPKIDLKDKGKKVLEEEAESDAESEGVDETERKFDQLAKDKEIARKVQEDWEAEEEMKKLAEEEVTKAALIQDFNDIQARFKADRLLAARLQEEERETFTVEERAKFIYDTIAAQRRFLAQQRAIKRVVNDTPREEDTAKVPAEQEVTKQGTKKRKSGHVKMIARKRPRPQPDDDSDDEHIKCLRIVTFDSTIDSEIMETKSFVSKLHKVSSPDGDYLVVYKVNGHFMAFNCIMEVLHISDRKDLFHLYDLVMKQYLEITLEGIELILWGDLKIMMESSTEENDQGDFWNNQQEWEILRWRLYEACGVCLLDLKDETVIYMLVERRYPLSKELLQIMLDLGLEVEEESTAALHLQTAFGKDKSNPLIVDSLLKTIRLSIHLVVYNEELAIPEQTATGGKLKENQGCRVDTNQVHQNGDLKNRSVWIHPPGLQDVYTKET